jgi:hypothetical protein
VHYYSQELVGVSLGFVYSSSYVRINLDFPSSGLWRGLVVDECHKANKGIRRRNSKKKVTSSFLVLVFLCVWSVVYRKMLWGFYVWFIGKCSSAFSHCF